MEMKVCKNCGSVNEFSSKNCNSCHNIEFWGRQKIDCTNCSKPIRDHDADTAHECLELTSLEILSQNHSLETQEAISVSV